MPNSWQKFLTLVFVLLAAGTLVGWLYGRPELGLLAVSLGFIAWQIRRLLTFERALRTRNFDDFQLGEGIWQQMYSRFSHERQRARNYKQQYRRMSKELRKSINAMPDGGIVLDPAFDIVNCNKTAQRLVGIDRKKDKGQRVDNIVRDPHFIKYLNSGKFKTGVEFLSPVTEGDWLFCRLVPYGEDQHLLLISDITEQKKLATMRRDFVANASHELRTPLTVVSGYLDTLAEDDVIPTDWKRPIEQMRSQTNRMNAIVAELLELSRLEVGGPDRSESSVDVATLLAQAKKACSNQSDSAAINVVIESEACLSGNTAEIESVISNLLSNAIRHTPADGEVTLTWSSNEDGAELSVADTGEGIAEQYLARLTERFFRVDSGRSRANGGVGLGLAIVKHALMRHEATLEISSQVGEGSRFVCKFPATRIVVDRKI
jgi:two-component system, OmpR family, phosphate regulon sensor histidine kinase PhoR